MTSPREDETPTGIDELTEPALPTFCLPMVAMRHSDGGCHAIPESGVYAGVLCVGDTTITMSPVVVPDIHIKAVVLAVELASYDDQDGDPTCCVKLCYLARDGVVRSLVSHPIPVGCVFRLPIPREHVQPETLLATSVQVVLMDELLPDQEIELPEGVAPTGRRPVLFRGAWLEFPLACAE